MSSTGSSFDGLSDVSDEYERKSRITTYVRVSPTERPSPDHSSDSDDSDVPTVRKSSTKKNSTERRLINKMEALIQKLDSMEDDSSNSDESEAIDYTPHGILEEVKKVRNKIDGVICFLIIITVILVIFLFSSFLFALKSDYVLCNINQLLEKHLTIQSNLTAITTARDKLNKMKCLEDLPDAWLSDWIPEKSKFKGLDELVETYNLNLHEAMRLERSKIGLKRTSEIRMSFSFNIRSGVQLEISGPCVYHSEVGKLTFYLEDGNLHIVESYFSNYGKQKSATYVYRIDDADLI